MKELMKLPKKMDMEVFGLLYYVYVKGGVRPIPEAVITYISVHTGDFSTGTATQITRLLPVNKNHIKSIGDLYAKRYLIVERMTVNKDQFDQILNDMEQTMRTYTSKMEINATVDTDFQIVKDMLKLFVYSEIAASPNNGSTLSETYEITPDSIKKHITITVPIDGNCYISGNMNDDEMKRIKSICHTFDVEGYVKTISIIKDDCIVVDITGIPYFSGARKYVTDILRDEHPERVYNAMCFWMKVLDYDTFFAQFIHRYVLKNFKSFLPPESKLQANFDARNKLQFLLNRGMIIRDIYSNDTVTIFDGRFFNDQESSKKEVSEPELSFSLKSLYRSILTSTAMSMDFSGRIHGFVPRDYKSEPVEGLNFDKEGWFIDLSHAILDEVHREFVPGAVKSEIDETIFKHFIYILAERFVCYEGYNRWLQPLIDMWKNAECISDDFFWKIVADADVTNHRGDILKQLSHLLLGTDFVSMFTAPALVYNCAIYEIEYLISGIRFNSIITPRHYYVGLKYDRLDPLHYTLRCRLQAFNVEEIQKYIPYNTSPIIDNKVDETMADQFDPATKYLIGIFSQAKYLPLPYNTYCRSFHFEMDKKTIVSNPIMNLMRGCKFDKIKRDLESLPSPIVDLFLCEIKHRVLSRHANCVIGITEYYKLLKQISDIKPKSPKDFPLDVFNVSENKYL